MALASTLVFAVDQWSAVLWRHANFLQYFQSVFLASALIYPTRHIQQLRPQNKTQLNHERVTFHVMSFFTVYILLNRIWLMPWPGRSSPTKRGRHNICLPPDRLARIDLSSRMQAGNVNVNVNVSSKRDRKFLLSILLFGFLMIYFNIFITKNHTTLICHCFPHLARDLLRESLNSLAPGGCVNISKSIITHHRE